VNSADSIAGKGAFIADLKALHAQCGRPSYKSLADISQHLATLYPDPRGRDRRLRDLSVSAISEVLAGKRQGLPSSDWVASFVLCCQRRASETGVMSEDPGPASLPRWQAKLRAAHAAADGAVPGGGPPEAFGNPWRPVRVRLPPSHQAFVASHGPYGQDVLARAEAGHAEAVYRVAILLGTDATLTADAQALLIQATGAGHSKSINLLDANRACLPPAQVARHARDLALAAEAAGATDEAHAFYMAAARGGVPDCAVKFAAAVLVQHGEEQTAAWLAALSKPAADAGTDLTQP
jgi:hypothetical protein